MKRSYAASTSAMGSTRLAQILVMQGLNASEASIQAFLLELIVTKELRISNVKYNVPKPFFLVIAVLPQGYNRLKISSQLVNLSANSACLIIVILIFVFTIDGSIFR
jgi:hypothetical protein